MKTAILSGLMVLTLGCATTHFNVETFQNNTVNSDFQDRYAVVVIGSHDIGNYSGIPESQNPFVAQGRGIYNQLKRLGFKEENMIFLSGNDASARVLEDKLEEMSIKVDGNDLFVIYIGTHGNPFALEMEADGTEMMTVSELSWMLEDIKPKLGLIYVDACYSGSFISDIELENYVAISSTGHYTPSYSNTTFSAGLEFFTTLKNQGADLNEDGYITIAEAFISSNESALRYQQEQINNGSELAEIAGFEQEMYVGDNVSEYYYIGGN